ncbi:MAG: isoleucine--tRNA ligase [Chloroflexota bacterium]
MFKPVPKDFNVPQLEHEVIDFWRKHDVQRRYLDRNRNASERFSFFDGPITANGVMGVHHAWGRTYKDVWQRYNTMLGKKQRYQNGFDCQGLWVEVTVERELGFTSKKDIERYGIAEFVRKCKESVFNFADIITRQSQRLGQFMDWQNSYLTLSDQNNFTIWHFLKQCHERGLLYQGTDVMPWCTRCGTGLSEHEIVTDGYRDVTHTSVYVRLPIVNRPHEFLLVWTTTPWTLTSNAAVALNPKLRYLEVRHDGDTYYLAEGAVSALRGSYEVIRTVPGSALLGWHYEGPFDELPAAEGAEHVVIAWDEVAADEGTGLVHIAPGCGKEDFALGKQYGLKVIAPLDQAGFYADGFARLTGRNVHDVTEDIVDELKSKGMLYRAQAYTHRYPTCWRCGTELVFRLVGEWFISMEPLRQPMMEVVRKIQWIPSYGLERELDWLRNMSDWMISKKRYWGLALPFWLCPNQHLQIIGGKRELAEKAISGLDELESPHRPWIDNVKLACPECGQVAERIPEVGNPWLDAGIVPFSTTGYNTDPDYWRRWFPADFITESFPGQFRNWFYSLLAMSTVLENTNPFDTVLGYQLVRAGDGREMHKSWGNALDFDEEADRAGADIMRWLFCQHNPATNVNFGWESLDGVKRRLLVLWNTYSFFVTYANLDGWEPGQPAPAVRERPLLDRWVLGRLHQLTLDVRSGLDAYDAMGPSRAVDGFIEELSTWYVRRSRRRFWRAENDGDKAAAYATLYECLTILTRLIAPFMPFLAESLYQNLVSGIAERAADSVHLTDFPVADAAQIDVGLLEAMSLVQQIVTLGRAARDRVNVGVRQPLGRMYVKLPDDAIESDVLHLQELQGLILDELNVKSLELVGNEDTFVTYGIRPNLPVLGPRFGKRMPAVQTALEQLEAARVASDVQAGKPVHLGVDGAEVVLAPEEILVSAQEHAGYAAMASGGILVALDTELTDDLIMEGYARQVVRHINSWRKDAGLEIDDRIHLRYRATPELTVAIRLHSEYICRETLAVSVGENSFLETGHRFAASFGEQTLEIELNRAL